MISVDGLVAIRALGLKFLAGADAGGRLVTWAHACDLPDPWVWFEAGDLVMTTGGGLPVAAEEQVEWISKLIDVGVSGIVFALESHAPVIHDALTAAADERHFPVLSASFDLQFVTLARTVIESAIESERSRLAGITRLYETYWRSLHARGSFDQRLSALRAARGGPWRFGMSRPESRWPAASRPYVQSERDRWPVTTVTARWSCRLSAQAARSPWWQRSGDGR